jgi:hypothetical protein
VQKNLASKLYAISKPYFKTLIWKHFVQQQQQPVQKITCPTRVSLYPKGA